MKSEMLFALNTHKHLCECAEACFKAANKDRSKYIAKHHFDEGREWLFDAANVASNLIRIVRPELKNRLKSLLVARQLKAYRMQRHNLRGVVNG